jgi:hypothetical protein
VRSDTYLLGQSFLARLQAWGINNKTGQFFAWES